jgi:hypothetical protein
MKFSSLKIWFITHAIVDLIIALPLLFYPVFFLEMFGFSNINPLLARLIAAALLAIGGNSYLMRNGSKEEYKSMLNLKLIWSIVAIFSIGGHMWETHSIAGLPFLLVFGVFAFVWLCYRIKLK